MKITKSLSVKIALFSLAIILCSFTVKVLTDDFDLVKNLDIFYSLTKELNTYYVDEVDNNKLVKKAMDEMLKTLDPYTVYIPSYLIDDARIVTTGKYGGIGIGLERNTNGFVVNDIYENSPAATSGLQIGDVLTKINGVEINKQTMDDLSVLLKGLPGTFTDLEVKRMFSDQALQFKIKRDIVSLPCIPYSGMIDSSFAYIRFSSFSEQSSKEFEKAFNEMRVKNPKGLIIDLRENGGGLMFDAINIVNFFVKKGEQILETKSKLEQWNKTYKAENHPIDVNIPIVVLINRYSASASEIVSGALQDLDRAVILGEKSFGKGLVQTTRPLPYDAQLKITIAKYYIPSGRCIQRIHYFGDTLPTNQKFYTKAGRTVFEGNGITPDVKILENDSLSLVANLERWRYIFDFITYFHLKNPEIKENDFRVTEDVYKQFTEYCFSKNILQTFDYYKAIEKLKKEGERASLSEIQGNTIDILLKNFKGKIGEIFKLEQSKVSYLLQEEFARRNPQNSEKYKNLSTRDRYVKEAISILKDKAKYDSYLRK